MVHELLENKKSCLIDSVSENITEDSAVARQV